MRARRPVRSPLPPTYGRQGVSGIGCARCGLMWPKIAACSGRSHSGNRRKGYDTGAKASARGPTTAVTSRHVQIVGPSALTARSGIGSDVRRSSSSQR